MIITDIFYIIYNRRVKYAAIYILLFARKNTIIYYTICTTTFLDHRYAIAVGISKPLI